MLVCAFINGCYLEIEYCSMVVFNCGRQQHHKHLFLVVNEGKCKPVRGYKCETMDF
nr:MIP04559p [Drosophila melanogaster]